MCEMPVLLLKAVVVTDSDRAKKKDARDVYDCPVYMTQQRGPTLVFSAGLKTKVPPSKWILSGAAIVLEPPASHVF